MIETSSHFPESEYNSAISTHNLAENTHNLAENTHNLAGNTHNLAENTHNLTETTHNLTETTHNLGRIAHSQATKAQVDLCRTKDAEIINKIDARLEDLILHLPKRVRETGVTKNKHWRKQLSILIYFFKHLVFKNQQTLGETYANVKSSRVKNLVYMLYLQFQNSFLKQRLSTKYSYLFDYAQDVFDIFKNMFSLKLLGVESTAMENDHEIDSHFKLIGQLQLVKLLSSLCLKTFNAKYGTLNAVKDVSHTAIEYKGVECLLCSGDNIKDPAVGKCGHVFCYGCYIKWASKNLSCPLCRFKTHPREIVPLRN